MISGMLITNPTGSGPRLLPAEVEAVFLDCYQGRVNMDASKPAVPIYWERAPKEN